MDLHEQHSLLVSFGFERAGLLCRLEHADEPQEPGLEAVHYSETRKPFYHQLVTGITELEFAL